MFHQFRDATETTTTATMGDIESKWKQKASSAKDEEPDGGAAYNENGQTQNGKTNMVRALRNHKERNWHVG